MNEAARSAIQAFALLPHPEGGFYRETFRSPLALASPQGPRAASTAIYFLLPSGTFSALHRVRSDEVWHHYDGDALDLHMLDSAGMHEVRRLGKDVRAGEEPQIVVPAGLWQAAVPAGDRYSLCGCTVAPGFDFADFEMPTPEEAARLFPQHAGLVARLTRR
jgi:predicted cupin superfamily sugar epimerase